MSMIVNWASCGDVPPPFTSSTSMRNEPTSGPLVIFETETTLSSWMPFTVSPSPFDVVTASVDALLAKRTKYRPVPVLLTGTAPPEQLRTRSIASASPV